MPKPSSYPDISRKYLNAEAGWTEFDKGSVMSYTLHLIANAHLDPVWLWDRREGLNQGLATCRTVLDLLDEDTDLTFIRGEAALYEHIERFAPETFARITKYVAVGRWEIVGGTYVQPDTNLPATETLARQFLRGQRYFESRFGKSPRIAWAADSFGHSAGLPELLAAAGVEGYAFSRPAAPQMELTSPAFWWQGAGGSRVLAYRLPVGWYGCERDEIPRRLDASLAAASEGNLQNIGVFYGLGDHGGGPSRRHLADIRAWAAQHPEVQVIHSGLHRLFDCLREEADRGGDGFLPTHEGELNFCLRGCYVSAARVKLPYRKLEAELMRAERTDAIISAALARRPADLSKPWDAVLFNSFHDILPGTSIERALDEQIAQIGGARYEAQTAEFEALTRLAAQADTQVEAPIEDRPAAIPFLIWNPHPYEYQGSVELETCLDDRPLFEYEGRTAEVPLQVTGGLSRIALPFQRIAAESDFLASLPWRTRVLVPVVLPPLGWSVMTLGYQEAARSAPAPVEQSVTASTPGVIANGLYSISAQMGETGVHISYRGRSLLERNGLSAITVEDPWGCWGGLNEEPGSLDISTLREVWKIDAVRILEEGPERASLWVRLLAGNSRLDLTFSLCRDRNAIDVAARVFWNERAARLKLVLPALGTAEFEVPGGSVQRGCVGEVPGGRWVQVRGESKTVGFASDALYGFDCRDGALNVSVVRSGRYASDRALSAPGEPWRPSLDEGELRFRFLLTGSDAPLNRLACELEQPPVVLQVPAGPGRLPREGSLAELLPDALQILALKPAEDEKGWVLRVQETAGVEAVGKLVWMEQPLSLGRIGPREIASWKITTENGSVRATRTTIGEDKKAEIADETQ